MESMALASALVLLVVAVIANVVFPSSFWFLIASALAGVLLFTAWRSAAAEPATGGVFAPVLAVAITVLGLLVEIERPLTVNFACGFSVVGAVMFGSIEAARRLSREHPPPQG